MAVQKTILISTAPEAGPVVTPTPGGHALLSFEANIDIETDELERKRDKSYIGADAVTIIGKRAKISFDFELMGAAVQGSAAPIEAVLLAAAMAGAQVPAAVGPPAVAAFYRYTPLTANQRQAQIYFYWGDGGPTDLLFVVSAAKADISFSVKSKEYWKGKATFTGSVALPTEAGAPSGIILSGFQNPVPATTELAELEFNGTPVRCYDMQFALNNEVKQIEDFKTRKTRINARNTTGTFYVVKEDFSVANWYALSDSQATNNTIRCVLDDGPGRAVELFLPTSQIKFPKLTEYEGEPAFEIPFIALPTGSGNNEFRFDFK